MKKTNLLLIISIILFSFSATALTQEKFSIKFRNADIKSAIRLISKMDGKNVLVPDTLTGSVTVDFHDITLKSAMDAILKSHGLTSTAENNVIIIATLEAFAKQGYDLETKHFNLKYSKADEMVPQVQTLISERGSVIADTRTNTIIIKDNRNSLENIEAFIKSLDTKDQQVLIEAKIIEASSDFINSLGIQWGVNKTGGKVTLGGLSSVGTSGSGNTLNLNTPATGLSSGAATTGLSLLLGFGGTLTDMQLTAAEEKGSVKILSKPTISTLNNQPAKIHSGIKFYVKTSGDISISGASSSTTTSGKSNLESIETGIDLVVTPQISINEYIKLNISATESSPDFSRAVDGIPAIIDNTATTTVLLKNKETTVIGGLIQKRESDTQKGVPYLSRVPILGALFRSKTKTDTKSELIIFITPTILKTGLTELPKSLQKK
jgi:type IV pilus assembly protein PilQ